MRIAHITDLHCNDFMSNYYKVDSIHRLNTVFNDVINREVDLIIFTGDYGDPSCLKDFFIAVRNRNIPYYLLLGNHDSVEELSAFINNDIMTDGFLLELNEKRHSILLLNSYTGTVSEAQITLLKSVLTESNKAVYIFIHHPIVDCGNTILDKKYPLENRDDLKRILHSFENAVYIFAGHYHNEYENISKNIRQYVTPSCMVQLAKSKWRIKLSSKKYGYRLIDINDQGIFTESIMFD